MASGKFPKRGVTVNCVSKGTNGFIYDFIVEICKNSTDEPLAVFWQEYWLDLGHWKRLQITVDKIESYLTPDIHLLDVGSFGEFPLLLRKMFGLYNVSALNMEGGLINYGDNRLLPLGDKRTEHSFLIGQCDIEQKVLPYESESMGVVTCFEVLEHLRYDPMFVMREINRVLVPGGKLVLTTPNSSSWGTLARVADKQPPIGSSVFPLDGSGIWHCKEYAVGEIEPLFLKAGFTIEKYETFDCLPHEEKGFESRMGVLKEWLDTQEWWNPVERRQNHFVIATKISQPQTRKYTPLYTGNVLAHEQQPLSDKIDQLKLEIQRQKAHIARLQNEQGIWFLFNKFCKSLFGGKAREK